MTETSAFFCFPQMDEQTPESPALEAFFGEQGQPCPRFLRVHMDSCDYSLEEYTAVEDPIADPDFETFSLKRDQKYILRF